MHIYIYKICIYIYIYIYMQNNKNSICIRAKIFVIPVNGVSVPQRGEDYNFRRKARIAAILLRTY